MPLKAIPTYIIPSHIDEAPRFIFVLWAVGGVSTAVTFFVALRQLIACGIATHKLVDKEGYIIAPWPVQYTRIIIAAPMMMAAIAYSSLFVPGMGYFIDLCINIFAAVVLGALVNYYLEALGQSDSPSTRRGIVDGFAPRRWYCGTCCGGISDPLCCLGLIFRKAVPMKIWRIRLAYRMVGFWSFCFLFNAIWTFNTSQYFTQSLEQDDDGWCQSKDSLEAAGKVFSYVSGFSSLVGLSGLCMIAGLAALAVGEEFSDTRFLRFNAKRKAECATVYLFLLFWEWVIGFVPVEYRHPVQQVPVLVNSMPAPLADNSTGLYLPDVAPQHDYVLATFKMMQCPIYDRKVCTFLIYCTLITVFMAFTSLQNKRLYPPADMTVKTMSQATLLARSRTSLSTEEDGDSEKGATEGGAEPGAAAAAEEAAAQQVEEGSLATASEDPAAVSTAV